MDQVCIEGLAADAIIGIHEWERRQKQAVRIDLALQLDTRAAAASDAIGDTVNYGDIARLVTDLVADSRFNLIEALAETIANAVLEAANVHSVTVTVHKPGAVANADDVKVRIERSRR